MFWCCLCAISCCFLNACVPSFTAYSTPSTSPANRFVSVGPRDPSFVNIPQQTQVGRSHLFCMWCSLFYSSGAFVTCLSAQQAAFPSPCSVPCPPNLLSSPGPSATFPCVLRITGKTVPAVFASCIEGAEEEGFWARTALTMASKIPQC